MKVYLKDLGASGWMPDVDPAELPPNAWSDCLNVRFVNGRVEQRQGYLEVARGNKIVPLWLAQHSVGATKYIIQACAAKVFASDGSGTATDITGTAPTGDADDKWTGGVLGGILVLNNGVDVPTYWDGNTANNLVTLTDWTGTERCKALRPFKNYLVALNITKGSTNYPHMVKWSHSADPGALPSSWDETDPAVDAGEQDLADTQDEIVDGLPLGDIFVIYKERSMYGMQFIGAPLIWRFFRLPDNNQGAVARNCVAQTPQGHVVFSGSDVFLHNGQGVRSLIEGRARQWLIDTIDPTYYRRSFVAANDDKKEVWVCFPESGKTYCTMALVWNWDSNTLSRVKLPRCYHGVSVDADLALDPWNGGLAGISYSGFPTDPVGVDEWDYESVETWSTYVDYTSSSRTFFLLACDQINIEGGHVLAADLSSMGTYDDHESTRPAYGIMTGFVQRSGFVLNDDHGRFKLSTVWPRYYGEGITASYMPSMQAQGTDSPETATSFAYATTSPLTKAYTPHRYTGVISGRYLSFRIDMSATYPARFKTLVFDVQPLGQY